MVISAGIGCGPARDVVVSVGAGVRGGGPAEPSVPVVIAGTTVLLAFWLGVKENIGLNVNVVVVGAGCGEGKDPRLPTLEVLAILMAAGAAAAAVTGKLKVLAPPPPPPADESKLGVLGGADGCG